MRNDNLERFTHLKENLGWKCDTSGIVYGTKGQRVGYLDRYGYLRSTHKWDGKPLKVSLHSFVYFYFTGKVPTMIDHINNVRTDNRLDNLRVVTPGENTYNRRNIKGYRRRQRDGLYYAKIHKNKVEYNLGKYKTEFEARSAYLEAKARLHTIEETTKK
jgi:hypothetical protein